MSTPVTNSRPAARITGARRGIGKAIALALAEAGFDLALADLEHSDALEQSAKQARSCGANCVDPT